MRTEDIATEVFFFPAAAHTEKDGTFTNTQRMVQWHHKARRAPATTSAATCGSSTTSDGGSARAPGGFGRRDATGRCSTSPGTTRPRASTTSPSAEAVLAEISGYERRRRAAVGLHRAARPTARPRAAAGSTAALRRRRQPDRAAEAAQRAELDRRASGRGRGRPTAASSTTAPRPTPGPAVVRAQGARLVGCRAAASGRATTRPTSRPTSRRTTGRRPDASGPEAIAGDDAVHHAGRRARLAVRAGRRRRRAAADALRAAGLAGAQPAARPPAQPGAPGLRAREQPLPPGPGEPGADVFPYVGHDLPADRALHRRRHEPLDAVSGRAAARVLLRGLAGAGGRARARARAAGRRSSARAARSRRA